MLSKALARIVDLALPWFPGDPALQRYLREPMYGFRHRPVGLSMICLGDLRVRKEPARVACVPFCDGNRVQAQQLLPHPIDRFFPLVEGFEDRRLEHLPHCRLLRHYEASGELPSDSDYANLIRERARLERRSITEACIRERMERFLDTHRSVASRGYLGPGCRRRRITVMDQPIHPPMGTYRHEGIEIFDGHHRAASLKVLGIDRVEVLIVRAERVHDFDWDIDRRGSVSKQAVPGIIAASRSAGAD